LFNKEIDLESYDEMEERGEAVNTEDIAYKFRLLRPLGKLHNIIVYSCSNNALMIKFEELAGRLVPLDNRTR
jgi:hypothetical protein